jgi:hypothetical protein
MDKGDENIYNIGRCIVSFILVLMDQVVHDCVHWQALVSAVLNPWVPVPECQNIIGLTCSLLYINSGRTSVVRTMLIIQRTGT